MAYAIIEMGGKQYRVEKGDSVVVDRLAADEGAKVNPRALLYAGDGNRKPLIEGADLEKVKIEAVVAEHLKGDKIRVFKYRPKKRYRKTQGYRSSLSRIEIREIKGPSAAKAADGSRTTSKRSAGSSEGSGSASARATKKDAQEKEGDD